MHKSFQRQTMKPASAFFVLSLLLLILGQSVSQINGKKGPEEYWKDVVKDQDMPEAIKGLLKQDEEVGAESSSGKKTRYHFKRNFDARPIAIIYHQVDREVEGKP
ncbi:hypothetical protein Ancab_018121 [Ancistrocladus abbreviatus]